MTHSHPSVFQMSPVESSCWMWHIGSLHHYIKYEITDSAGSLQRRSVSTTGSETNSFYLQVCVCVFVHALDQMFNSVWNEQQRKVELPDYKTSLLTNKHY